MLLHPCIRYGSEQRTLQGMSSLTTARIEFLTTLLHHIQPKYHLVTRVRLVESRTHIRETRGCL